MPRHPRVHAEGLLYHVMARGPFSCLPSVKRKPCTAEELIELSKSDTYLVRIFHLLSAMRIFSPLAVAGLCVTIGRYWYLFKRLTAVSAGRFYRFEHIATRSSFKAHSRQ